MIVDDRLRDYIESIHKKYDTVRYDPSRMKYSIYNLTFIQYLLIVRKFFMENQISEKTFVENYNKFKINKIYYDPQGFGESNASLKSLLTLHVIMCYIYGRSILDCFIWGKTKEGDVFWRRLNNKLTTILGKYMTTVPNHGI